MTTSARQRARKESPRFQLRHRRSQNHFSFLHHPLSLQILPNLKLQILNTNLIIRLLIILIPVTLLKADTCKFSSALGTCAQPFAFRLELDKLETAAVEFDELLALGWGGVLVGCWGGEDCG